MDIVSAEESSADSTDALLLSLRFACFGSGGVNALNGFLFEVFDDSLDDLRGPDDELAE